MLARSAWLGFGVMALCCVVVGCDSHENSTVQPDATPPPPIESLRANALSDSSVLLLWNLPTSEEPAIYEIGISTQPFDLATEGGWNAAAKRRFNSNNNGSHAYVVDSLAGATKYWFAIRSRDAAGNVSTTSTIASATTDEKPPVFFRMWGSRGSGPGQLMDPVGLVMADGGPLLVADDGNHRIQPFNPSSGTPAAPWGSYCDLSTGEGCVDPDGAGPLELGDRQFGTIGGVATDSWGNVYVVDKTNRRIVKFRSDGAFITKWDVAVTINSVDHRPIPLGIDIDPDGTIYLNCDAIIIVYDLDGRYLRQVRTTSFGGDMMASDHRGHLYFNKSYEDRGQITKMSTTGTLLLRWGSLSDPTCSRGQMFVPQRVGIDGRGNVYVPDGCGRVQKFDAQGTFLTQWGTQGAGPGQFDLPRDVLVSGNAIYVLEDSAPGSGRTQTRIQMFYGSHLNPLSQRLALRARNRP